MTDDDWRLLQVELTKDELRKLSRSVLCSEHEDLYEWDADMPRSLALLHPRPAGCCGCGGGVWMDLNPRSVKDNTVIHDLIAAIKEAVREFKRRRTLRRERAQRIASLPF